MIEDPHLLHRVLGFGIERLGPLERLVRNSGYSGLGDARETVLATGLAFKAACRAWRIGRGRPVTREVLQQANGVSVLFLERVVELAAAVSGDARQLLQNLSCRSLKGWRDKSTQELREYLTREGYFDEAERLTPEAIRETVLAELLRAGSAERVAGTTLDRVIASLPS